MMTYICKTQFKQSSNVPLLHHRTGTNSFNVREYVWMDDVSVSSAGRLFQMTAAVYGQSPPPPVFCRIRLVVAHGRIAVEMQSNRSCSHRINRPRRLRRLLLVALLTRLPWLLQQHQYHQHRSSGRKQTSG